LSVIVFMCKICPKSTKSFNTIVASKKIWIYDQLSFFEVLRHTYTQTNDADGGSHYIIFISPNYIFVNIDVCHTIIFYVQTPWSDSFFYCLLLPDDTLFILMFSILFLLYNGNPLLIYFPFDLG